MADSTLRIIVTGLIGQHALLGGVAWDYLQYVLGLTRLGHEVYYVEDSGEWPYRLDGGPSGDDWVATDCTANVRAVARTLAYCGLADRWAYRFPPSSRWFGLSNAERIVAIRSADLLINVSGALEHPERYRDAGRLVYVDTDPVFTQLRVALGETDLRKRVDAHDVHFSVGECLGDSVPDTGHFWKPTKHPIVLSEWSAPVAPRDVFTTVLNWTSYAPLQYDGQAYGQKDAEFLRFLDLPSRVSTAKLEVALGRTQHVRWQVSSEAMPPRVAELVRANSGWTPRDLLTRAGWGVVDAVDACGDFESYRQYVLTSRAEWSVAKNGYVRGQSGWFSGRSGCYLAAGRPVIVQDTGFGSVLPVGEGVLPFSSTDGAVAAVEEVERDYARHAAAARAIAAAYFDSNKVLTRMIEDSFI